MAQPYKFWANNLEYLLNVKDRSTKLPGRREQKTADDSRHTHSHIRPISFLSI